MEFNSDERKHILLLGIVSGVIVTFSEVVRLQGASIIIDYGAGLLAMLLGIFGMTVSIYIHEKGHQWVGRKLGYKTNTEGFYPGQVIGVVIAIFTFGAVQFFTPNTADLEADPTKRMHKHRRFENPKQQAIIAASGLLFTAAWAVILHGAYLVSGAELIRKLMIGNVLLLIYSMIPFEILSFYMLRFTQSIEQLPQSDGLYIFQYSVVAYATAASFVLLLGLILAWTTNVPLYIAVLVAMVTGVGVWLKFFLES